MPRKPLTQIAEEQVSFALAASWVSITVAERGYRYDCFACGSGGAFKAYADHAWCHSCRTYFSAVSLLARKWDLEPEDAARAALERIGYVPLDYAGEWKHAQRSPDLDLPALGDALRTWCAASIPGWAARSTEPRPARALALCLGLLPEVRTEEDCATWLARCKQVMGRALGGIT